jgi:HTH-type transcriptional regulator / antitoxin HigA
MTAVLERYQLHDFAAPAPVTSEAQNKEYTAKLIELESRDNLTAEEKKYADVLAALIEKYEREKFPDADVPAVEIIRELMEANGLRQKDLADVLGGGHESAVSEILNGKRPLSITHIERLSQRFKVSPAVFFTRSVAARR